MTFEAQHIHVTLAHQVTLYLEGGNVNGNLGPIEIRQGQFGSPAIHAGIIPVPTREGFTFLGWREDGVGDILTNAQMSSPMDMNSDRNFVAAWEALITPTPTPSPSPTPTPNPTPPPTPIPSPTPSPTPTSANTQAAVAIPTPTPAPLPTSTPTPAPSPATRPNPQTGPAQIGFVLFGALTTVGLSSFGIVHLTKKHKAEINKNNKEVSRHNREERIIDIVNDTNAE